MRRPKSCCYTSWTPGTLPRTRIGFCLQGVVEQCRDSIRRIDNLVALRADYRTRVAECGGSARLMSLVDGLFSSPLLTIPQVAASTSVTYPTAKKDVVRLVKLGILAEGEPHKLPRHFYSPQIFDIAYGEP